MSRITLPKRLALAVYLSVTAVLWIAGTVTSGCSSSNGTNTNNSSTDASPDHTITSTGEAGVDSAGDSTTNSCGTGKTSCGGTCVNTSNDPKNCGVCGATCGTGLVCSGGQCSVGCASGQTLCGTGTCTNTQTDFDNCGSCGNQCQPGQVCSGGKCGLFCTSPLTSCNGSCVNTTNDTANCGGCGKTCAQGQVCSNGNCAFSCGGNLQTCSVDGGNPFCTNTQTDNTNCGSCGNVCGPGQVCSKGQCQVSCTTGDINCNGNCIDPTSDNQFCGATAGCGVGGNGSAGSSCGPGQACSGGLCTISCPTGEIACGGLCIDPKTSISNCGATAGCGTNGSGSAGQKCPQGEVCSAGTCQTSCQQGLVLCSLQGTPTCIDPNTNPNFCGASGNCQGSNVGSVCAAGQVCSSGVCGTSCQPGQVICNINGLNTCIDPQTNPTFCGASGNCTGVNAGTTCQTGHICFNGNCQITCGPTQALCQNQCVDPLTNNTYCGATVPGCAPNAGTACQAGQTCQDGGCVLNCQNGLTNCNVNGTPTCVNLGTDPNNCGVCGTKCPSGQVCTGGSPPNGTGATCQLSCQSPQINCGGQCIDPNTSQNHCGATTGCGDGGGGSAGTPCNAIQQCSAKQCVSTCGANQIPCDVDSGSPYCASDTTDNNNCGSCHNKCGPLTQCGGSGTCNSVCTGTQIACDVDGGGTPYCANYQTDNNNCGSCGNVCSSAQLLQCGSVSGGDGGSGYQCVSSCAGTSACTAQQPAYCANLATDNNNCGGCSYGATSGPYVCQPLYQCEAPVGSTSGSCISTCATGEQVCPPTDGDGGNPTTYYCADLLTDPLNCNNCNHQCLAGQLCSNGTCQSTCNCNEVLCSSGSPHCSALTSNKDCGGCGQSCTGSQTCLPTGNVSPLCTDAGGGAPGMCCPKTDNAVCNVSGTLTCVDGTSNTSFCGATGACGNNGGSLGVACAAGQSCLNGACGTYHWVALSTSADSVSGGFGTNSFTCDSTTVGKAFASESSSQPASPSTGSLANTDGYLSNYTDTSGFHSYPGWAATGTGSTGPWYVWECVFQ